MTAFTDIFGDLFDDREGGRAAFSTLLSGLGGPINRFNRQAFEGQFDSLFNRFLGSVGQSIIDNEGNANFTPENFAQFAEGNFTARDARRLPGAVTGLPQGRQTPTTRFLFLR